MKESTYKKHLLHMIVGADDKGIPVTVEQLRTGQNFWQKRTEELKAENAKLKAFHDAVGKADREIDTVGDTFKDFYIAVIMAYREVK